MRILVQFIAYTALLLTVIIYSAASVARSNQLNSPLLAKPRFLSLSTIDGLAQDSINDMLIDQEGFLYIGSEGGLQRWDGYQLQTIRGSNDEILHNSIFQLFQDSRGYIWISTDLDGVFRLNLQTNEVESIARQPFNQQLNYFQRAGNFFEDNDGNILMSLDESVIRYDYTTHTTEVLFQRSPSEDNTNYGIRWALNIDDILLVASREGLFAKATGVEAIPLEFWSTDDDSRESNNVKHLYVDSQNRLWIATVQGLFVTSVAAVKSAVAQGESQIKGVEAVITGRNIWRTIESSKNQFWVGTDIGLMRVKYTGQFSVDHILEPMKSFDTLSKKDIRDIEIDQDGNLLLATNYGGVLYWSPNSLDFKTIRANDNDPGKPILTDNTIWALFQDNDDQLWIGTDNGLTQYDFTTQTSQLYFSRDAYEPFSDVYIDNIFAKDDDTLLLQSLAGIWEFDKRSGQRKIIETSSTDDTADLFETSYGSAQDHLGRIWFANVSGFHIYNPADLSVEGITLDERFDPVFFKWFLGFSAKHDNQMWMSVFGGLWMVDHSTYEATVVHQLPENLSRRELYPTSVVIDQQGILWIAYAGHGLYGLDSQTFEQKYFFDKNNMLASDMVFALVLDDDDNLWFSSHSGLHKLVKDRSYIESFRYGLALDVAEFNEGAVVRLNSNQLAFGSPSGIVYFDPKKVTNTPESANSSYFNNKPSARMAITEVKLATRSLNLPFNDLSEQTISLDHNDNGLSIRFSSLEFSKAAFTRFKYSLLLDDKILSTSITAEPVVSFPLLKPGDYTFIVEPTSDNQKVSVSPATLSIQVKAAPWNTAQAKVFYFIVTGLLLTSIWWFRQKQKASLEQARGQLRLFGDAFKQTRDWVVIFSHDFKPIAINPAFERAFALRPIVPLEKHFEQLAVTYADFWNSVQASLPTLRVGGFWRDEQQLQLADGKNHDVLIDLSAVSDDSDAEKITHYLMVFSDITEQKQAERKLLKLATYDSLTGLVNRSLLLDRLEHAIVNANLHKQLTAILFVDLDRFKGINDSLGHEYGDNLLRVVAKRMLGIASKNDTVARMGGDEFVIIREEAESFDLLGSFIQQLIESVEEPISINNETLRVSCSVGVSIYPNDATEPSDLLRYADVAMYSAKADTLNRFRFFTEEMNVQAQHRLTIENVVKQAYQDEAFYNVYQPIVNTQTQLTEGMELLMRCAVSKQNISPKEFIPILEEMRLIVEVTRISIAEGVKQLAIWYQNGYRGYLSVNLSALHFSASFDVQMLEHLLDSYSLPASALRFEVTESILMADKDAALIQFRALKNSGYQLALDDFGTGYSSLSYLKMFPLDVLKIDKSFIDDIGHTNSDDSLVITTIGMARNLKMDCIAEGIETLEQVHFLMQQDCFRLQGYYFSRPVPEEFAMPLAIKHWELM